MIACNIVASGVPFQLASVLLTMIVAGILEYYIYNKFL